MENCSVACPRIIKGGGGKNLKGFFLAIQFFRGVGGPAQKMMFPTKKVAK